MLLSTIGLSLDILGVILLFFVGMPPNVRRGGGRYLLVGQDEGEARKAKRYDWYSRLALIMVVVGFGLQIGGLWTA